MRIRTAALVLSSSLALGSLSLAQNLLQNADFNSDLNRWSVDFGLVSFSEQDWLGDESDDPGSALVTNNSATAGASTQLRQCIALLPGTYHIGVLLNVPPGQARTGSEGNGIAFYDGPSCTGTRLGSNQNSGSHTPSTTFSTYLRQNIVAPAGTVSAYVYALLTKIEAGGTLQAYFDHAYIAAAHTDTRTIPASASIHGVNGAFFQTDLWVVNESRAVTARVTARHRCAPGQTCGAGAKVFDVSPGGSVLYSNVLVSLFGDAETSGAIELSYDAGLVSLTAGSRTYSPSLPAPTAGTAIPALGAREVTRRAVFYGIAGSGGDLSTGFRTNAGAYNPSGFSHYVSFNLYAADGTRLGGNLQPIGPYETLQLNDVFKVVGKGTVVSRNAYLVIASSQLDFFPFVTVIDNQSQDSVFIPAEDTPTPF